MQASFTHMMRDFKATSCFLHVRCSNAAALPLYRDALGFRVVKTEVNVVFLQSACVCRLRLHSMFFPASSCLRESKDSTRRCRVYKASRCVVVTPRDALDLDADKQHFFAGCSNKMTTAGVIFQKGYYGDGEDALSMLAPLDSSNLLCQ